MKATRTARTQEAASTTTATTSADPHVIDPRAVYDAAAITRLLGLKDSCVRREVRLGRLKAAQKSGRYLVTGEWLLQWLAAGADDLQRWLSRRREKAATMPPRKPPKRKANNGRDTGGSAVASAEPAIDAASCN